MSSIRNYLDHGLPKPILDIDVQSLKTEDSSSYLFDYSLIPKDNPTYAVIEQSVDSIIVKCLTKDFDGLDLPITDTYKACIEKPRFLYVDSSSFPTDPYYADGYIQADDGTRIQIVGGAGSVNLPVGKTGFKWQLVPSNEAWDPTGSFIHLRQLPICDFNSKLLTTYNLNSFDIPSILKKDSGYSVIVVHNNIGATAADKIENPAYIKAASYVNDACSFEVNQESGHSIRISSFGNDTEVPYSNVYIYNSQEYYNLDSTGTITSGEYDSKEISTLQFPIEVSGTDGNHFWSLSRFILWNRDIPIEKLIDYYNNNVIPLPAVHYDISKQYHDNTHSYGFANKQLLDLSGNGLFGELKKGVMQRDPVEVHDTYSIISNRCEATEVSPGVWHVTKLTPANNEEYNRILLRCPVVDSHMFGNKFSIYISTPPGKTFDSTCILQCSTGVDGSDYVVYENIREGINEIDLSNYTKPTEDNLNFHFEIPSSFYDLDADGNKTETVTDFYIVFFPYLDMTIHGGWAYYSIPDFTKWYNYNNNANIIYPYKVDTSTDTEYIDFCLTYVDAYADSSIVVFNPIKAVFKASLTTGSSIRVSCSYSAPGESSTTVINKEIYSVSPNKDGLIYFDFPGAVLTNPPEGSNYYIAVVLGSEDVKGLFELLPLGHDYYQFQANDNGATFFHIYNKDGSLNIDKWNTVLMEFTPALEIFFTNAEYYCQGTLDNIDINESKEGNELAYYYDVPEGSICYINGEENTTITAAQLRGKRLTVAITADNKDTRTGKYIGCVDLNSSATSDSNASSTFKFYKFMAFKEKLTKEQINIVMDKYGFTRGGG